MGRSSCFLEFERLLPSESVVRVCLTVKFDDTYWVTFEMACTVSFRLDKLRGNRKASRYE